MEQSFDHSSESISKNHRKILADWGFSAHAIENMVKYAALVKKWQKAINLVSPKTIPQLWDRHLIDSAQLWPIIRESKSEKTDIIDLGSGGGFPSLVLAIAGADHVQMIESDMRKCIFMREVARELGLDNVTIHNTRIENADIGKASFVTARALAPLSDLYEWGKGFSHEDTAMVFLKGQDAVVEIDSLHENIRKNISLYKSATDDLANIVVINVSCET